MELKSVQPNSKMTSNRLFAVSMLGVVTLVSVSYHILHIAHHDDAGGGAIGSTEKDSLMALVRNLQREHKEMSELLKTSLSKMVLPFP